MGPLVFNGAGKVVALLWRGRSVDNLPDQCLLKIIRYLTGPQERSNSICVSKHWLLLLSHICVSEILMKLGLNESDSGDEYDNCEFLERSLVAEANDIGIGELMGSAHPMHNLKSLSMASCRGDMDLGLEVIGNGTPNLKQLCLRACFNLSDAGLEAFVKAPRALKILEPEECNRITLKGVLSSLLSSNVKLYTLELIKCSEIKDIVGAVLSCQNPLCMSLQSLTIRACPGFTSDRSMVDLVRAHGESLYLLHFDGCHNIIDTSLLEISEWCDVLVNLDASRSTITDYGVATLASARQLDLQKLPLPGFSQLTKMILSPLENMGSSLTILNLHNCMLIGDNEIDLLRTKIWWCGIQF